MAGQQNRHDTRHQFNTLSQSLATGRLATFSLPFVDCELPFDADQTIGEDGSAQPSCEYPCSPQVSKLIFSIQSPFGRHDSARNVFLPSSKEL